MFPFQPEMLQQQVLDTGSECSEDSSEVEVNIFDKAWGGSDVVLVVEDVEFHVHRSILSVQSPVFKVMFEGKFKDAAQEKIELKEDSHEAMYDFLRLLYPPNMLHVDEEEVDISDENIFKILEVADKYTAVNIIRQCIKEAPHLQPKNALRLLPYAIRHELELKEIFNIVARGVKTEELGRAMKSEDGEVSVYVQLLLEKCRLLEDIVQRTNTRMLHLFHNCIEFKKSGSSSVSSQSCVQHKWRTIAAKNFKRARKCENCLTEYKSSFLDQYAHLSTSRYGSVDQSKSGQELLDLLKLLDDIVSSL